MVWFDQFFSGPKVDTLLDTWESYTGFCYKHMFPPTLSERIKSRLYFLASQTRWDWRPHVDAVLPSGGALLDKVKAHPITQPDLPVILRVLETLSMDGSPPFREMTAFQGSCFQCFPVSHAQRMTLTQVGLGFVLVSLTSTLTWLYDPRYSSCTWRHTRPPGSGRRRGSTSPASSRCRSYAMSRRLSPRTRLPRARSCGSCSRFFLIAGF